MSRRARATAKFRGSKGRGSKVKSEEYHFRRRCIERVGVVISQDDLKKSLFDEASPNRCLERQSHTKSLWSYTHTDGREFVVVYDKPRHTFITIYPKEWYDSGTWMGF